MIFSNQLGKLDGYTSEEAVRTIANHIRKMQEEMEYRLMTLDSSNISEISLDETKVLLKGQPLQNVLQDNEGMSVLEQKVNEINGVVSDLSGNYAQLRLDVDGLGLTVVNEADYSTVQLTKNGVAIGSSQKISMSGLVTFSALSSAPGAGQTKINGGWIETNGLVITSANLPDNVAYKSDIPTSTSELTNNSGFTSLSSVKSWVNNQGFEDATGIVSIIEGTVNADFVNALQVAAAHLSGNVISVKQGIVDYAYMYAGQNSAGTTAFELSGTMGLRLTSPENVYLASGLKENGDLGAQITMGSDSVSIGGILRFANSDNYGYELPDKGSAYTGQVFFLLLE